MFNLFDDTNKTSICVLCKPSGVFPGTPTIYHLQFTIWPAAEYKEKPAFVEKMRSGLLF
jgi:hypothetical protein